MHFILKKFESFFVDFLVRIGLLITFAASKRNHLIYILI